MKPVMIQFESDSQKPKYQQLYEYISRAILSGEMQAGEKLPSLRKLARDLGISVTTAGEAYSQLQVEGYIYSRPQAGYFVSDVSYVTEGPSTAHSESAAGPGAWTMVAGRDTQGETAPGGGFGPGGEQWNRVAHGGTLPGGNLGPGGARRINGNGANSGGNWYFAEGATDRDVRLGGAGAGNQGTGLGDAGTRFGGAGQGAGVGDAGARGAGGAPDAETVSAAAPGARNIPRVGVAEDIMRRAPRPHLCDPACFDFGKWKTCAGRVLSEFAPLLTFESDPRGEEALRSEIAGYIYRSRGVFCTKDQIIIAAGTQQTTLHISRILHRMGIGHVAVEEPGYLPVKNILKDSGFVISPVNVGADGIDISGLPANIRSAVYVCPSNQFPTGAVMPVGRRLELLEWARRNDSLIIEDDYDSELRYFGRPVPALQGLDQSHRVIYLGSFSSTLFPAVKISYMVLPPQLAESFSNLTAGYTQTCSKMEQLTLALFMSQGYYQTGIRKLRNLYGQKLQATSKAVEAYGQDFVEIESAKSGLNMIVKVRSPKSGDELCREAAKLKIEAVPVSKYADTESEEASKTDIVLYYHQLPLKAIDGLIRELTKAWRA